MRCPRTRSQALAAGTISITGCSAITWASAPARTASSAFELRERILRTDKAQAAARLSGAVRDRRRAASPSARAGYIAVADLPFEFMLNALRLNEGFTADAFEARTGLPTERSIAAGARGAGIGVFSSNSGDGWQPTDWAGDS